MKSPQRVIFAGTPDFAVPALRALIQNQHKIIAVYTQPDRPAGRGRKLHMSPVKQFALTHDLNIFQPLSLRDTLEQEKIKNLKADIMIVAAYGLILPKEILVLPKHGCLNIHASLLPRWRGAAPIQRAVVAGDTETGITIMQMDAGLDTGNMLLKISCPITLDDTSSSLHDKLMNLGADALIKTLEQYKNINAEPQDNNIATYAKKITRNEAKLDWNLPAEIISRQIRGFNPKPGAFTGDETGIIKIWQAEIINETYPSHLQPGSIIQANKNGLDIATGAGQLRIKQLQLAGGRAISIAELLNSKGDVFNVGVMLDQAFHH